MKKLNLLSRAEMRKVMGGDLPGGGGVDCTKECECDGGTRKATAIVKNCNEGSCDDSGNSVSCTIGTAPTGQSCATACGSYE